MLAREVYEFRSQLQAQKVLIAYSGYVSEGIVYALGDALSLKQSPWFFAPDTTAVDDRMRTLLERTTAAQLLTPADEWHMNSSYDNEPRIFDRTPGTITHSSHVSEPSTCPQRGSSSHRTTRSALRPSGTSSSV